MPYGLVTVDGRPLTGPGGIWLAGDVVAAPVVSAYDIDETIEPYRSMSNENISGSFADVVNAYENGPNGRFYTWTGTSDTTYAEGTTFTLGVSGTATAPRIIRVAGNPASHKLRNARVVINGAYTGIVGLQLSGRANTSMLSLNGRGSRAYRTRITAWGHRSDLGVTGITEGSMAIALGAGAHDALVVRCEIDNPLPWTATEKLRYPAFSRGLLKMGIRIPNDPNFPTGYNQTTGGFIGLCPLRVAVAFTHFHDFIGKPVPGNYNSGQTDFGEFGFSPNFARGLTVGSTVEGCLFATTAGESGIVDIKSPGWLFRNNTITGCPTGNLSARGGGGGNAFESIWIGADCGGLNLMGWDNVVKGVVCEMSNNTTGARLRLFSGHSSDEVAAQPGNTRRPAIDTIIYGGSSQIWIGHQNGTVNPYVADTPVTGTRIYEHQKPTADTTKGYRTQRTYDWAVKQNSGYWESDSQRFTTPSPVPFVNGTRLSPSSVGINS
jgi:hypothetical protein